MADVIKLYKRVIDSNGKPTKQDVLDCGFSNEHAERIAHPSVNANKLVKNARKALIDRGIHYKEEM